MHIFIFEVIFDKILITNSMHTLNVIIIIQIVF